MEIKNNFCKPWLMVLHVELRDHLIGFQRTVSIWICFGTLINVNKQLKFYQKQCNKTLRF